MIVLTWPFGGFETGAGVGVGFELRAGDVEECALSPVRAIAEALELDRTAVVVAIQAEK